MTSALPTSVQLSPPDTIPPTCEPGSMTWTEAPASAAATAAVTPAPVAPYTSTSGSLISSYAPLLFAGARHLRRHRRVREPVDVREHPPARPSTRTLRWGACVQ